MSYDDPANIADEFDDLPDDDYVDDAEPEPAPVTTAPAPRYTASFDGEGNGLLTVIVENRPLTFTTDHPHFHRILDDAEHGRIPLDTDFEVVLENIPGVRVSDGVLYFDGWPVHSKLADTIKRYFREGRDTTPLTRFAERLQNNPNEESREQLFTWADAANLTIDEDGYLIGFKSVTTDLRSHHKGPAVVNGEEVDPEPQYLNSETDGLDELTRDEIRALASENEIVRGDKNKDELIVALRRAGVTAPTVIPNPNYRQGVPNAFGAVVELPREACDSNPGEACSTGLHFGTWNYVTRQYNHTNSVILEVRVDPADVVSVPTHSSYEKVRCCRYEVIGIHDHNGVLAHYEPEATNIEDPEVAEKRLADTLAAQDVPRTWIDRILFRRRNT